MYSVAIIGTAGRDKDKPYNSALWEAMFEDATHRFGDKHYGLVSGGAAWADHLAVELFLAYPDKFKSLKLFLPAPLGSNGKFVGPSRSAGSASNWYHDSFEKATGIKSRANILLAAKRGAELIEEPEAPGLAAFFARNMEVAKAADACLAYTWGSGSEPADGGTKHTWNHFKGKRRVHISLERFV